MRVAIDGPAGAGKSTVSKAIAAKLGYIYIDTGAMYRTVGYSALKKGIDIKNRHDLMSQLMDNISIDMKITPCGQLMFLDGEDVTSSIRTEAVGMAASDAAVIGEVREKLVRLQREFAEGKNVVMDGRDIGTHVLPDAECKIYLTASVLARGKRRYDELCARGEDCSLENICRDIEVRDENDSSRSISPLRRAEDAVLLDTTDLTLEQSVAAAEKIINEKLKEI
ncbi:MAG: (d)CMP kinase [Clostridia bacterium]|nr:(d)CMP kinase [Clostridia bacterium]